MRMRVFVTGATGYLGSAVLERLLGGGHEVHGLTRVEERAASLRALGAKALVGDLANPESFVAELKNCDAVVHAAFHDGPDASRIDQSALEAIRSGVLDGRVRRVLYTSGVWVHGDTGGNPVDESSPTRPAELVAWRPAHEEVALDLVEQDATVAVLRPGILYGANGGILGAWFREARERKTVTYPGDGGQHWSVVHREDAAEAYRLALEHAQGGQRYLLTDESAFTVRELAVAAARAAGAVPRSRPREQVARELGAYGKALLLDQRVVAAKARRELGWVPRHTSFVNEASELFRDWLAGERAPVL